MTAALNPITAVPEGATPAQILIVLGFLEFSPRHRDERAWTGVAVWGLLQDAVKHYGVSRIERRRFIGGLRSGKAGPALLKRAEAICEAIGQAELNLRFGRVAAWAHVRETGRLPPGWVWSPPAAGGVH